MSPHPRPALQTIVKAAGFARAYIEQPAGHLDLGGFPFLEAGLLVWLTRMAKAVQQLPPSVKALRPKAPWLAMGVFEDVDPLRREYFLAIYPDDTLPEVIRKAVLPLGRAAAQILAEIEERGLPVPSIAPPASYQFKVSLVGITPPIWRRLLISNQVTLHKLHMAIQIMGGWWNYHLHLFEIAGTEYGYPDPDGELHHLSSARYKLNALPLAPGTSFRYIYDFGDHWELKVLLEDVLPLEQAPPHPLCLGGERAFPHEDCGGVHGYREMVKILRQPKHPEYEDMRNWAGQYYDPETFDLDFVNRQLRTGRHLART
jgi:hypothetical protein